MHASIVRRTMLQNNLCWLPAAKVEPESVTAVIRPGCVLMGVTVLCKTPRHAPGCICCDAVPFVLERNLGAAGPGDSGRQHERGWLQLPGEGTHTVVCTCHLCPDSLCEILLPSARKFPGREKGACMQWLYCHRHRFCIFIQLRHPHLPWPTRPENP